MADQVQPERYFVTGGAGFVGVHFVERLLSEGNAVTVYDKQPVRDRFRSRFAGHEGYRDVLADIKDVETLNREMAGHDVVVHLAANTDIPAGNLDTELDLREDIVGTRNILEAMRALDIRRLIFSSTSAVYGDAKVLPTPETYGPLQPISLYGAAKVGCETYISAYAHLWGIQAWIFRFANIVGHGMVRGVIHDFIAKLLADPGRLDVYGDGSQSKSFLLVEDCIGGMLTALRTSDAWSDVFNLGMDSSTDVRGVASIVIEEMGLQDVHINYRGGPRGWPGDTRAMELDFAKMRSIGWHPSTDSDGAVREAARRLIPELRESGDAPAVRLPYGDERAS